MTSLNITTKKRKSDTSGSINDLPGKRSSLGRPPFDGTGDTEQEFKKQRIPKGIAKEPEVFKRHAPSVTLLRSVAKAAMSSNKDEKKKEEPQNKKKNETIRKEGFDVVWYDTDGRLYVNDSSHPILRVWLQAKMDTITTSKNESFYFVVPVASSKNVGVIPADRLPNINQTITNRESGQRWMVTQASSCTKPGERSTGWVCLKQL